MKTVVITGSTRGIGYGLAEAFLDLGCKVLVNGRSPDSVDQAIAKLGAQYDPACIHGQAGDVASLTQMEALWQTAVTRFGQVDIWINNAGLNHPYESLWKLEPEAMEKVVNANILGTMIGSKVAIQGMLVQGHGQLFNMEGAGSNGKVRPGMSVYSASKAAVTLLSNALIKETEGTAVQVGTISPGMVVTDLLMEPLTQDPAMMEKNRRIFNILTDRVETIAPFLAQQMLASDKTGTRIKWLTTTKIMWRFLTAPISKRDPFAE